MRRRALAWGALVVAAYVAAAYVTSGLLPLRPLFDGLAPAAPYRWVSPPPDLAPDNQPPAEASQTLGLRKDGNDEASVATLDGQATVIVPQGTFVPATGKERALRIHVEPRNPADYGPAPEGLTFSGNAYDVRATFAPGAAPATPVGNVTILLTYAVHATKILELNGETWRELPTETVPAARYVFAKTKRITAFAPAGPAPSSALRWWTLGIASGLAALLGAAFGIRERRRLARGAE